jgi:hypothetical protein
MSSAMAPPPILQTETTQSNMALPTPAASPLKRKQSISSDARPRISSKRPRLDPQAPPADKSSAHTSSTRHYAVYLHNLDQEPATARPKLLTTSTDFETTHSAMRTHATQEIDKNVEWGATRELSTALLFEILDSKNRIMLRYEFDVVFPRGEDAQGGTLWDRASDLAALPVYYSLYVEMHCNDEERAERFFIAGFESKGEATHAMKTSAAAYIARYEKVRLREMSVEMVGEEGEVVQRYSVVAGRRNGQGRFFSEGELELDLDGVVLGVPVSCKVSQEEMEVVEQMAKKPIIAPALPTVVPLAPRELTAKSAVNASSETGTEQVARRQSSRIKHDNQPVKDTNEALSGIKSKPKPNPNPKTNAQSKPNPKAPAKSNPKPNPTAQIPAQAEDDLAPHCTCRLPDDGTLMIHCDNETCQIGWYHGRCVGISKALPKKKKWYCEVCAREMERRSDGGVGAGVGETAGKKKGGGSGSGSGSGSVKTKTKAKARKRK